MLLDLQKSGAVTLGEKQEIDVLIERTIKEHKGNSAQINKLTMDSVTALTISEARANEISNQGFLKRVLGNITGRNQGLRADIDRNITKVQYASQQMIQKLAEQNLLTFDIVTAVNNKLNTLVIELDQEINQVYETMIAFFKQTRSDIIQLEARVEKLEQNVELLHWNTTIEYQIYEGVEYTELPDIDKIVCLSNDFYHLTKGEWSTADLMLLKSTLAGLELAIKSKISTKTFYYNLIEKPSLIDRLFKGISLKGLEQTVTYEAPLVKGIEKLNKINGEEKYIYESIVSELRNSNVPYEKYNLQLSMVKQYLLHTASMNIDVEINLFDFIVGLLINLQLINSATISNEVINKILRIGDYIELGSYKDKKLLWKIINKEKEICLLFSNSIVDEMQFVNTLDYESAKLPWDSQSPIRHFLNSKNEFLRDFSSEEIEIIQECDVEYYLWDGKPTYDDFDKKYYYKINYTDKVFLLSHSEIEEYLISRGYDLKPYKPLFIKGEQFIISFFSSEDRFVTEYFLRDCQGLYVDRNYGKPEENIDGLYVWIINESGDLINSHIGNPSGIRPVLCINAHGITIDGEGTLAEPYRFFLTNG